MPSAAGSPCALLQTVILALTAVAFAYGSPAAGAAEALSAPPAADYWEDIAPLCNGYPSKAGCVDGDMTLFAGLLCASGDQRGCEQVRNSQAADGRWWRAPRRKDGNLGEGNSFSRDMSLGVLLYLVTTRDTVAAQKWLAWIEGNRPCLASIGGHCAIRGPARFCTDEVDQSCTLAPNNWSLLGRVWDYLGMPLAADMHTYHEMDGDTLPLLAAQTPAGFQLHLQAVEIYLKQKIGVATESRQKAASIIAAKEPLNPFFRYLDGQRGPALLQRILDLCPSRGQRDGGAHSQWTWERENVDQAAADSMGWDCLFLTSLPQIGCADPSGDTTSPECRGGGAEPRVVRAANRPEVWYITGAVRRHVVSADQLPGWGYNANMAQVSVLAPADFDRDIAPLNDGGPLPWVSGCYRAATGARVFQFAGPGNCGVPNPAALGRLCPQGVHIVGDEAPLYAAQSYQGDCQ